MKKLILLLLTLPVCLGVAAQQTSDLVREVQNAIPSNNQLVKILEQAVSKVMLSDVFLLNCGFRIIEKKETPLGTVNGYHTISSTTYLDGANRMVTCEISGEDYTDWSNVEIKVRLIFQNYNDFITTFVANGFVPLTFYEEEKDFLKSPNNFILRKQCYHYSTESDDYYIKVNGNFHVMGNMCIVNVCFYDPEELVRDFIEDDSNIEENISFDITKKEPEFMGGDASSFTKWVRERLNYPEKAKEVGAQGSVIVSWVVGTDGSVKNITIVSGVHPALDKEVVRVISSSPRWTPGYIGFIPFEVSYETHFTFQLPIKTATESNIEKKIRNESKPMFLGGDEYTFSSWVCERLNYPEKAKEAGVQGRVRVSFAVGIDGRIKEITVISGVHPALDKEVVRVMSSSPKWTPGYIDGKPVEVSYKTSFIFQLR